MRNAEQLVLCFMLAGALGCGGGGQRFGAKSESEWTECNAPTLLRTRDGELPSSLVPYEVNMPMQEVITDVEACCAGDGHVRVGFEVGPEGRMLRARVTSKGVDAEESACVLETVCGVVFLPFNGPIIPVDYPFRCQLEN